MESWNNCKNILLIRADDMGDVLMSSPAFRALKQSFHSRLTLLTSERGREAGLMNPDLDEVIASDLPWVKNDRLIPPDRLSLLISQISAYQFDGCIIFTVYSQNPLPSAMLAYLAQIPLRLAYCRENPYELLTDWIPDPEPFDIVKHQVRRDLDLVTAIGARTNIININISLQAGAMQTAADKLRTIGLDPKMPFLLLHPAVSESKREYPADCWIACGRKMAEEFNLPLLLTGTIQEVALLTTMKKAIGDTAIVAAGLFSLEEFTCIIQLAKVVVSVNTGTVHLAAAVQTPVVVLYAQTNPQHTPWMVPNVVVEFSVPGPLKSKNKLVEFVDSRFYYAEISFPDERIVTQAVRSLMTLEG